MTTSTDETTILRLARILARRVDELDAEIAAHAEAGRTVQAYHCAHTATYLRMTLVELVGPCWQAHILDIKCSHQEETP